MYADDPKSKYHGSKFYIERLHKICAKIDEITLMREVVRDKPDKKELLFYWRANKGALFSLHKELSPKMDKETKNKHEDIKKHLEKSYESATQTYRKKAECSLEFLELFDAWEMKLRDFMEERGLLMPDEDDDSEIEDDV